MSFIIECPNCKEERIEKFKGSSYWDKEENKLCPGCRKLSDAEQRDLKKELDEAREYVRTLRNVP